MFRRKALFLATGLSGVYFFQKQKNILKKESRDLVESAKVNGQKPIYEMTSRDRLRMPWEKDYRTLADEQNWEMRRIKVRGTLLKSTHLVARERNGQKGYLVFRPFKTANSGGISYEPTDERKSFKVGFMVNVGWIPESKAKDAVNVSLDFIKPVENDPELPRLFDQYRDIYTGYVYNSEGDDVEHTIDCFIEEEVELTGYLRKGEKENRWIGRKYFFKNDLATYVDLKQMATAYNFSNIGSSTRYYLQLAVNEPIVKLEEEHDVIPGSLKESLQTAKLYEFDKILSTQTKFQLMSLLIAGVGVIA